LLAAAAPRARVVISEPIHSKPNRERERAKYHKVGMQQFVELLVTFDIDLSACAQQKKNVSVVIIFEWIQPSLQ
jgi:hypothetical protein